MRVYARMRVVCKYLLEVRLGRGDEGGVDAAVGEEVLLRHHQRIGHRAGLLEAAVTK